MDVDARRYWTRVVLFTALSLIVIVAGAKWLAPLLWPIGLIAWLLLAAGIVFLLVRWHVANTAFRCPGCGHVFTISASTDLWSPNFPDRQFLQCPACERRSWCKAMGIGSSSTQPRIGGGLSNGDSS